PGQLAGGAAWRARYAHTDRDRHARPRAGFAFYVHAAADEPCRRLRDRARRLRCGDAYWHRQSCAGKSRGRRSGGPDRTAAISARGSARGARYVPRARFLSAPDAGDADVRPARIALAGPPCAKSARRHLAWPLTAVRL